MSSHSVQNYVNTIGKCVWEKLVKLLFIWNIKSVFLLLDQSPYVIIRIRVVHHSISFFFVQSCLELPGFHPLQASHCAARLVCQRTRHAVGKWMEQVETGRQRKELKSEAELC